MAKIQQVTRKLTMDSDISHCFVKELVTTMFQGVEKARTPVKVKIADRGMLAGDRKQVGYEGWCQRATFKLI
jgi:hypothetical protein